jgi:hypothetical protein
MSEHYARRAFGSMNGAKPLVAFFQLPPVEPFSAGDEPSGADP